MNGAIALLLLILGGGLITLCIALSLVVWRIAEPTANLAPPVPGWEWNGQKWVPPNREGHSSI